MNVSGSNASSARRACAVVALCLIAASPWAKEAAPVTDNPQLERRVLSLSEELRCLVCQNQSLADSDAELAVDLRNQIRDKLGQGMSEKQVVDYMVERYGDFVRYRPPFKAATFVLWFGPLLLLIVAVAALFTRIARRRAAVERELTDAERAEAAALLAHEPKRQ